ncbi:MAG: T9SS type A sorting domain-containing protein [Bacteroidota bacterium]
MITKIKIFITLVVLTMTATISAQTTAMDFSGLDCNGNNVDLFADLEAGKAVVLFFYMPNCGSCPPHAEKIQAMGENLNVNFPGKFKAYSFPYQNSTSCSSSAQWALTNNLSLFSPMDSGAVQVAYYGGFAMPTTVLLGSSNKDVLFVANANNSNSPSDTTTMKAAILNLFAQNQAIVKENNLFEAQIFPNPATDKVTISFESKEESTFRFELYSLDGKVIFNENQKFIGFVNKEINLSSFEKGNYLLKISSGDKGIFTKQITIR